MSDVELREQCYSFLLNAYFPIFKEQIYHRAGERAYRDFCRTFHTNVETKELRCKVCAQLEKSIQELCGKECVTQETYDIWHFRLSENISHMCNDLTYGHIQKWINMAMKYLLVLEPDTFRRYVPYMHVPIDRRIILCAKKEFGLKTNFRVWSQIASYELYMTYQTDLRKHIKKQGKTPMQWEFGNWK